MDTDKAGCHSSKRWDAPEFTSCEVVRYAKLARVVRRGMNRREFLQSTAATAVAAGGVRGLPGEAQGATTHAAEPWPENGTLIPDEGWRLWLDRSAEWKQDAIFLPEDVTQGSDGVVMGGGKPLPVNAPTGGWGVLAGAAAGSIPVTLPGTVEQHYWGKFGAGEDGKPRPYTPDEYRYAAGLTRADRSEKRR